MSPDSRRALNLIDSCGRSKALLAAGHVLINRYACELLRAGLIRFAPRGYALTPAGKAAL